MSNWNMKQDEVRRPSDGSIDTDYYIRRARRLRALALNEYLIRGKEWMLRKGQALARLIKGPRLRLKKAKRVENATLHVPAGGARINVNRGRLIRVEDSEGLRIRCYSGSIWITQEDDRRDIVLRSGETFILDRPGLTLIAAIADVQFALEDPRRAIVSRSTKKSPARIDDRRVRFARA